jgi:hypothetical protein
MSASFKVVNSTLSSDLAAAGTFTFNYPTGTDENSYAVYGHIAVVGAGFGVVMLSPADFTLTFGTGTTITFTYGSGKTTIPAGSVVSVQLNLPAEKGREGPLLVVDNPLVSLAALVRVDFGSPVVADADGIFASASITSAAPITGATMVTGAAHVTVAGTAELGVGFANGGAPFGRNVVAAWTTTSVMTVTGTDYLGNTIVESSASGTSMTGKKAFATVTQVAVSVNVTSATVGTGDVLGLPFYVGEADGAILELFDAADDTSVPFVAGVDTVATATTGDVRGTWNPNATLDGNVNFVAYIASSDPTYTGVAQFAG